MNLVGIRVYGSTRIGVFKSEELEPAKGQICIIDTDNGPDYGEVVIPIIPRFLRKKHSNVRKIIRLYTEKDRETFQKKIILEKEAYELCLRKNEELNIPMKLVRVLYTFDMKKATFYYTAAGRVDFRQLVKDLARNLRIRVEMRQIGVRDEARMLPGCGTCGKTLCCSTFLLEFTTVSMKMAKEQNLVLNPSKVSGVCGRLKCCLAYEYHGPNRHSQTDDDACNFDENQVD